MTIKDILSFPFKAYAWFDGKKTYAVGWSMVLLALGGCLNSLVNTQNPYDVMKFFAQGAADPNVRMLLEGMAILTGRQALGKAVTVVRKLAKRS